MESAGTWAQAGLPAAPSALQAAQRLGIHGLETHVTREVSQGLFDNFDLILVMEQGHREAISGEFPNVADRLMLLSEAVDGVAVGIPDPFELGGNPEQVAAELQALIYKGRQRILELAHARQGGRHSVGEGNG